MVCFKNAPLIFISNKNQQLKREQRVNSLLPDKFHKTYPKSCTNPTKAEGF